jgi:hypothetical protein
MKRLSLALALVFACEGGSSRSPVDATAAPQLVHFDLSPPLRDIVPRPPGAKTEREPELRPPIFRAATDDFVDLVAQTTAASATAPAPLQSFEGQGAGFVGPAGAFTVDGDPPDTNGDVGPNHYVQTVNVSFTVFSKTGTAMYGPAAINTVWAGFGGGCETSNDGDPILKYDSAADRWLLSQFMLSATPNLECIAISATGDPMGQWHRYAFSYTAMIDYPKIGVWPDAYYVTQNVNTGNTICAFERAAMLAGTTAKSQCFTQAVMGLMPADVSGHTMPPAGSPEYVLAIAPSALQLWKLHVDWTTPAMSAMTGPTNITVAAFTQPTQIKQPGSTTTLDAIGEQLMYGLEWRAFSDHESLVVNHTVGSSGKIGVRWYEIQNPGTAPTVFQQGTYVPDTHQRWMGSINIDHAGDIALGFSVAGDVKPSIHYAGRTAADPAGMLGQGEASLMEGTGLKTDTQNPSRWGDYSTVNVDPADDCTFWYTQEYLAANGADWHTRIGSFKFDACAPSGGSGGSGGSGSNTGSGGDMSAHHMGSCAAGGDATWVIAVIAGAIVVRVRRRKR